MKVKVETPQTKTVTLRIDSEVMKDLDVKAKKNGISRQKLVNAILKTALKDKNFTVIL